MPNWKGVGVYVCKRKSVTMRDVSVNLRFRLPKRLAKIVKNVTSYFLMVLSTFIRSVRCVKILKRYDVRYPLESVGK